MSSPRVVTIHYTLRDKAGKTIDSSIKGEPLTYLEGVGNIIPGLESALTSASVGEKKSVSVKASDGYGERSTEHFVTVPRTQFPKDLQIKVGDTFQSGSGHHARPFSVSEIRGDEIILDGNHPMAGQDLHFEVEVMEIRAATAVELEHGHVHGPGGHHH